MKNNTRGLIFHILIIIFTVFMSSLINAIGSIESFVYGNILTRGLIVILILALYYMFGGLMTKRAPKRLDFLAGNFITLYAIIFTIVPYLILRGEMFEMGVGGSLWKLPIDTLLYPELYMLKLMGFGYSLGTIAISSIIPNIIYGVSIKRARSKLESRQRMNRKKKSGNRR